MKVKYDPSVEKKLERFPQSISKRIVSKIGYVARKEKGHVPLKESRYGYKIRVGDYRVLVDVENNMLIVRYVGHRSKVYKNP